MTWRQINAVGAGLLLAALLLLSPAVVLRVVENGPTTPTWWNLLLIAGFLVCAGGLAARYRGRRDPRRWAGILAALTTVGVATFPFVARPSLSLGEQPWIALLVPIGAAALGIALSWFSAMCCGIVLAAVNGVARLSDAWPATDYWMVTEAVLLIIYTAAAATGMTALRSQVKAIDSAEARAIAAVARTDLLSAQQQEMARWDAFIHDEVLATLEAARARAGLPIAIDLQQVAADALAAVEQPLGQGSLNMGEILGRLSRTIGVPIKAHTESAVEPVPGEVVQAIESAVAEACRNVRRHTPDGTAMVVTMDGSGGRLLVEVRDDGPGFDPARVVRTRMGIGVSIVGRMRAVGGEADVRSAPGGPTIVSIRWPAANR